jgi:hypothetical protein
VPAGTPLPPSVLALLDPQPPGPGF